MPRSSRSKSHKQSKHSSKDAAAATGREYSGTDEDVKVKERSSNGGKEDVVSVKVSKDSSVPGEKRKHGKDLSNSHGNGDVSEEYAASLKRREEKSHGVSDRWSGGSSDDKGLVINVEDKELLKSNDSSKVAGESKSKSSRRHASDSASLITSEKDNRGEKRKSERDSSRKESSQKEHKELKDKDRVSDRGRKLHSDKLEVEPSSKQADNQNQSSKRVKEITEWPIEEGLRNPELEKELEKRMRRRGEVSSNKEKYRDDIKETEDRQLSTRNNRSKDEKHKNEEYVDIVETRKKDEKHREDGERDRKSRDSKHRGESGRHSKETKYKDDKYHEYKYREDGNKETKYKDDKYMEVSDKDERSRDRKRRQDDSDDRDYKHKEEKRARDSKYRDLPETKRVRDDKVGTDLGYDDRAARYKDDKDRRRDNEKDESGDYKSRSSMKEQRSRYPTRDHHRLSKQEETETKYRDYAYEDRSRHNVHSSRDYDSAPGQSDKKVTSKPESRSSPQVDKSPSSTSNERKNLIKYDARKSLDVEEPGPRSGGSKDTIKDVKGSLENDNLSVSSPYTRNAQFSGNSKSFRPPPSPSFTEDERSKSNNRNRRMVDPNMNRSQSQGPGQGNWNNNVPSWPSPMGTGGYIPYPHVPPPMFHPLMQQFPPQFFGRPPMKLNPGLPYHVPDHGPPPVHGWDANNPVFGDESHLYNRHDWDRRSQLSNQGWAQTEASMEGQQKDGFSGHRLNDENGPQAENQPDIQPQTPNLDKNRPEAQKVTEIPQIFEDVKEDNSALISQAYLSRVDVSKDLTQPELYEQCTSMTDLDPEASSDELDYKILLFEEGVDTGVTDNASLFATIDDSVFQKAMFLYKKQKDEMYLMKTNKDEGGSADDKSADEVTVMEVDKETDGPPNKPEEPVSMEVDKETDGPPNKPEDPVSMEVAPAVVKQEEEHRSTVAAVKESAGDVSTADVSTGDVSSLDVSVIATESVEFDSVNLNRIHHHSPESTH